MPLDVRVADEAPEVTPTASAVASWPINVLRLLITVEPVVLACV